MHRLGWQAVFVTGGVLPMLLTPAFGRVLPTRRIQGRGAVAGTGHSSPVAAMFRGGLGVPTLVVWSFAFLVFLVSYAMVFWVPTLLTEFGVSPERAPLGAAAFGVGGFLGNLLMITAVRRLGVRLVLRRPPPWRSSASPRSAWSPSPRGLFFP